MDRREYQTQDSNGEGLGGRGHQSSQEKTQKNQFSEAMNKELQLVFSVQTGVWGEA